jgi:HEPN domain-containing protein
VSSPRVGHTPRGRAPLFLKRGEALLSTAELADKAHLSDGVATSAVQAAIAFVDAYTVSKLGMRYRGQSHLEVILLIEQVGGQESRKVALLFRRIIERKSEVEYSEREVTPSEAKRLIEAARSLATLVRASLA